MWIVRLVGSIATLEIEGSWFRIGPEHSINEGNAKAY
jgi:hypothetical protein